MENTVFTGKAMQQVNCDWVKAQVNETKALLQYDDNTIALNKQRALSGIETAMYSLAELQKYFENI